MSVLICGSMAYDHIMFFQDQFKNHILPDKVHILNVSFLVPEMRREFGGCAGNIAYNLNLLDTSLALPMATVGKDFESYAYWIDSHNINRKYIKVIEDACHALGGNYYENGKITGVVGSNLYSDLTSFSLHPVKAIAMGEGGVITTNSEILQKKIFFYFLC